MSQAPKTDLARELWETCPKCYGDLLADRDGALFCPQGHYRAANATSLPSDVDPGQKLIADGGERRMTPSLSIAHIAATVPGRKSTPFGSRLNLRVELANRKKAAVGATLPTLPPLFAERGRKSTPPFAPRARIGKGRGLNRLNWGGSYE